jgi:hypothetical protein
MLCLHLAPFCEHRRSRHPHALLPLAPFALWTFHGRTIEDPKVLGQLESLAMQTVEAQVSNAKNLAQAQAEKLAAEGRAAAGIARARGEAAVTQAQIDAENKSRLSQVCVCTRVSSCAGMEGIGERLGGGPTGRLLHPMGMFGRHILSCSLGGS